MGRSEAHGKNGDGAEGITRRNASPPPHVGWCHQWITAVVSRPAMALIEEDGEARGKQDNEV